MALAKGEARRGRPQPFGAGAPGGSTRADAVLDAFGLACYIAYSYLFWDAPILLDLTDAAGRPFSQELLLAQGLATCLFSLGLMVIWGKVAPLRRNGPWLAALAFLESYAVVAAWQGRVQSAVWMSLVGFVLSGGASVMRLGWEERMCVRGVPFTAAVAFLGYLMGMGIYGVGVLLPEGAALTLMAVLPEASFIMLVWREQHVPDRGVIVPDPAIEPIGPRAGLRECFTRVSWRIPAFVALSYVCFGATRMASLSSSLTGDVTGALTVVVAMLSCSIGVTLAYISYHRSVRAAITLAVPIMAAAGFLNLAAGSSGNIVVLCVANVGVEITKYIMLFLMIDVIIKDGAPALLCLALLRFAQWGGSAFGQGVAAALGTTAGALVLILVVLLLALMVIMGAVQRVGEGDGTCGDGAGQTPRAAQTFQAAPDARDQPAADDPPTHDDLAASVSLTVDRYGLSPRETDVLRIWATGHSMRYVEQSLFITQSTVKTHLNHIYAKTGTANREELLQLLAKLR